MEWGRVYGLAVGVEDGISLPGVELGAERPAGAQAVISLASADEIAAAWPGEGLREREIVHPDGDVLLSVDHHELAGYQIDAPNHARLLVDADGARVRFAPREDNPAGATSVLLGQALPLAATLHGLEVLHAAAVAVGGRAAAVCGHSGGGKSNLVARLVAEGGALLADDALAVGERDGAALAHAGPAFVHLLEEDVSRVAVGDRLVPIESFRTGKVALAAAVPDSPVKLAALYILDRGDWVGAVRISDEPSGLRGVAAATFVTVARTGERLRHHLDMCALIAAQAAVRRVEVGSSSPDEVAAAVWDDLTNR